MKHKKGDKVYLDYEQIMLDGHQCPTEECWCSFSDAVYYLESLHPDPYEVEWSDQVTKYTYSYIPGPDMEQKTHSWTYEIVKLKGIEEPVHFAFVVPVNEFENE